MKKLVLFLLVFGIAPVVFCATLFQVESMKVVSKLETPKKVSPTIKATVIPDDYLVTVRVKVRESTQASWTEYELDVPVTEDAYHKDDKKKIRADALLALTPTPTETPEVL